jgi:hypothetical protein
MDHDPILKLSANKEGPSS